MPSNKNPFLTEEDRKVLEWVKNFWGTYDYGPSLKEVSEAMGWVSKDTARRHVHKLVALGKMRYDAHKARTMRLA